MTSTRTPSLPDLGGPPAIMGIVNVTPDSFSDAGETMQVARALARAARHVADGAAVVDVGGESTRPGATSIGADDELRRILPVIEAIVSEAWPVILSVDTRHSKVANQALQRGVHIVNDVSGLTDVAMVEVVVAHACPAILMHMRGTPQTMMQDHHTTYGDVVAEVTDALAARTMAVTRRGVAAQNLWLDPGLGFAKTSAQSWQLLARLDALCALGHIVVVGASRKAFLGEAIAALTTTGFRPLASARDAATAAACAAAVAAGAHIVRVHDVAAVKDAVAVGWALAQARRSGQVPKR